MNDAEIMEDLRYVGNLCWYALAIFIFMEIWGTLKEQRGTKTTLLVLGSMYVSILTLPFFVFVNAETIKDDPNLMKSFSLLVNIHNLLFSILLSPISMPLYLLGYGFLSPIFMSLQLFMILQPYLPSFFARVEIFYPWIYDASVGFNSFIMTQMTLLGASM